MSNTSYTAADLQLFTDLERAAEHVGVTPYLIGAGAILLGPMLKWEVRLARTTRDWDFAVRVDSWERYGQLAARLACKEGGFTRVHELHRFLHQDGGILDVVPYGDLEDPDGILRWPDEAVMNTSGLHVLDAHHEHARIETAEIRVATLPALVGLKLLAHCGRREHEKRDIADVLVILRDIEGTHANERIENEALDALQSEELDFSYVGSYLLGRDVAQVFAQPNLELMRNLLLEADDSNSKLLLDLARLDETMHVGEEVVRGRVSALLLGMTDE